MNSRHMVPKYEPFLDLRLLRAQQQVIIQCPASPTADDLGAAFGLYTYFRAADKEVSLICLRREEISSPNLLEMIGLLGIPLQRLDSPPLKAGLLIMVNCGPDAAAETPPPAPAVCVVGNHRPLQPLPELSDVRPYLTSASTLVWKLLERAGQPLDAATATALLYGLYSASSAFREIKFPLDLDLKDALSPPRADRWIFDKLTRANLSMGDLKATARALDGLEYHAEDRFVVINVLPGDDSVTNFIGDLAMRVGGLDAAVVFSESMNEIRFKIRAISRELNAQDLASWLIEGQTGSFSGNREQVGGVFEPGGEFDAAETGLGFFLRRVKAYFQAHEIVDCAMITKPDNRNMRAYQKRPVQQGYLPSVALGAPGTPLSVRMLEGDIDIIASDDIYLLIGLQGEIYPIREETFRRAYQAVQASPPKDFVYQPVVTNLVTGEKIMIGDLAGCCQSRETRVLARRLDTRIKLFSKWDEQNYLYGRPGDWLVQRREDPSDLYIVTAELFNLLYVRVNP